MDLEEIQPPQMPLLKQERLQRETWNSLIDSKEGQFSTQLTSNSKLHA